jgi:hypothetical protein
MTTTERSRSTSERPRPCYAIVMRAVGAKVLKGKVVTRAKLPEGARLTVFVHEPSDVELDDNDEAAIASGVAEIRAGRYSSANDVRTFLRRR